MNRDVCEHGNPEPCGKCMPVQQEPYAWMSVGGSIWRHKTTEDDVPLYTRPYRREWKGLKEWEINDGLDQIPSEDVCSWSFRKGVYFAEKALKERNV